MKKIMAYLLVSCLFTVAGFIGFKMPKWEFDESNSPEAKFVELTALVGDIYGPCIAEKKRAKECFCIYRHELNPLMAELDTLLNDHSLDREIAGHGDYSDTTVDTKQIAQGIAAWKRAGCL